MSKLDYNEDDIKSVVEMTGETPEEAEKYILEIYKDFEDEETDIFDILDIIESETKAKKNNVKLVVSGTKSSEKEKKPRTIVTSDEKKILFSIIFDNLRENFGENAQIKNENKLITVQINDISFKIDLIQERKKKK